MKKSYIVIVLYYAVTFFCAGLLWGGCSDNIYSLEPTVETDTLYTERNIQKHIVIKGDVGQFLIFQNGERITEFDSSAAGRNVVCSFYANAVQELYVVYYAHNPDGSVQGWLSDYIILEENTEPDTLYLHAGAESEGYLIVAPLPKFPKG